MQKVERPILKAKRSITPITRKTAETSKDTPQMAALRNKMLARQEKGNAIKKSKISDLSCVTKEAVVKKCSMLAREAKSMTPQMRVIVEKIRAENHSPNVDPRIASQKIAQPATPCPPTSVPLSQSPSPQRRPQRKSSVDQNLIESTTPSRKSCRLSLAGKPQNYRETISGSMIPPEPAKFSTSPRRRTQLFTALPASKKNQASERMARIRGENSEKLNSRWTTPVSQKPPETSKIRLESDSSPMDSIKQASPPKIHENAAMRMKYYRKREHNETLHHKKIEFIENKNNFIEDLVEEDLPEAMDWEPIEPETLMQELQVVRSLIVTEQVPMIQDVPENNFAIIPSRSALYMVIDTNIFLQKLQVIEEARDVTFRKYGRPIIVVPYTVIRELDYIKDGKATRSELLKSQARNAIKFIYRHFSAKHPRFFGQTMHDVEENKQRFAIDCPDDEILQTCLQIESANNLVVLLSDDMNLCNKAMSHNITPLGSNDPLEKIDYLYVSEGQTESLYSMKLRGADQDENYPIHLKEGKIAQEIFDDASDIFKDFLSAVSFLYFDFLVHYAPSIFVPISDFKLSKQDSVRCESGSTTSNQKYERIPM